jgi:hypothetical protein
MTETEWQTAITPYIQQLIASNKHPYFISYITEREDREIGKSFTFGLDCLLDGITTYIARLHL